MIKATILVVDDEATSLILYKQYLEQNEYSVVSVFSGKDAIETVQRNPDIDLILMDIELDSGIDGPHAAREILNVHDIPIVFMSAYNEEEVFEKTDGISSYGYFPKKAGETVLNTIIKTALELFKTKMELKQKEAQLIESQALLRGTFESIQEGVTILSPDLTILQVNSEQKRRYKDKLPLKGKKCYEAFRGKTQPCDGCSTLKAPQSGKAEYLYCIQ